MTRWLPSFFALLAALAGVPALAGAPRLTVAAPVFDFGSVERGTRIEHVFKVRNDGDAPATVDTDRRVCACTVGTGDKRLLAPGQEAWITVAVDTRRLAGATAKAVTVRTNDPASPAIKLVMQGRVLADLVAEPPVLYLGEVRRGTAVERAALVRPGRPDGIARIATAAAEGPFVAPTVADDPAGGQHVVVRIADTAPAGRFHDQIVLRTADGEAALRLPVFGVVRADLHVEPAFVRLGTSRGEDAAVVQVVSRGGPPFRVRGVHVPSGVATWELETIRRGFAYVVRLGLRPGLTTRGLDDRIEILTDHPTERSINVPLRVVASASGRRHR
jgi:hypothetical protein